MCTVGTDRRQANDLSQVIQILVPHLPIVQVVCRIVTLRSISGIVAINGSSRYSVSKLIVSGRSRCFVIEYVLHGIRTNKIAPLPVEREMTRTSSKEPELAVDWAQRTPMRRWRTKESFADLGLTPNSNESGYLTGKKSVIDGGALAALFKSSYLTPQTRRGRA